MHFNFIKHIQKKQLFFYTIISKTNCTKGTKHFFKFMESSVSTNGEKNFLAVKNIRYLKKTVFSLSVFSS